MSKQETPTISAVLREAVKERVEHLYTVARGSGISYNSLWRFLSHERELSQKEIDLLARYLGLGLVPVNEKPAQSLT